MDLFDRLKATCPDIWRGYVDHAFVRGLGDGTLPKPAFQRYLAQDYLFLIQFARAYALAVFKSPDLTEMRAAFAGLSAILGSEIDLHVRLCAGWGLSEDDLADTPEALATTAYTRYVIDTGLTGDLLELEVALSPCVIGYAEIATRLAARPGALDPANPYRDWIADYSGPAYQAIAAKARARSIGWPRAG